MRVAALLVLLPGFFAGAATAEGTLPSSVPELEPGVSRSLAQWRAERYRDVRYALQLSISSGANRLRGSAQIEVTLPRPGSGLVLDWRPVSGARAWRIRVNGKPVKARFEHE